MQVNFKQQVLPHLLGIVSFYVLIVLYFSPIVFDGKMIFQNDILQWEGSAKEMIDFREETGEEALWTNSMFGGMPAYLVNTEYPGDISRAVISAITLGLPHPINGLFFGMVGMYLLLLSFRVRPAISVMGAWAFAFNTFHMLSLEAGHNAKIWAICLIPLILAGINMAFNGKKLLGFAITALALMLQIRFNHLQITYYTLIVVLIYAIGQLAFYIKEKRLPEFGKIAGILIVGGLIAVGANANRLISVLEYGKYSIRGEKLLEASGENDAGLSKEYAFSWSQGKLESLTLLIPNFSGGASQEGLPDDSNAAEALQQNGVSGAQLTNFLQGAPTYWGDQPFTGGPIYGSVIMAFLFVIGILYAPKRFRNIFVAITVVSLMLAWGKNLAWFNYTLFDYLPGYNKFRAVSMALGITLFAVPVLGCIGLEHLYADQDKQKKTKALLLSIGIVGGFVLLLILLAGAFGYKGAADASFPGWLVDALREDRKAMLRKDALRSLAFIVPSALLVFLAIKGKVNYFYATLGIAILVVADVWTINKRYLNDDSLQKSPSKTYFTPTPADQKVMQDKGYFRVLNLQNTFKEARTSYRFQSVGGYHGAKMRRYQDLIDRVLQPEISQFVKKAQEGNFDYANLPALNMLNTKYILAGNSEKAVFQNPEANGPAWFPQEIIGVSSNEEEINKLSQLNTKTEATLNTNEFSAQPGAGTISLAHHQPNKLVYNVNASKAGLVVFSEIYYPEGWVAEINGEKTDILRTNYLLRGVSVPKGNAEVVFKFEPTAYYRGSFVAVSCQYFIILLLIAGLILPFTKFADYGRKG
ncbi:YfhO family protein [Echinicola vietnamensis]|uniref:Bacterial membrane protein YfhO n=1 Tax=Echinicola vietnamensis (strain DSM 17526 / LMG 23754 / KMM 6221) TaxID=926556 RepID=L0G1K2_ECHVK|nr:YfhO family protein [Echinicola vietnamensis]AGA80069.1 Bacterial membrane protein YfhO [Echinicola vietnamensis DSM 17526]